MPAADDIYKELLLLVSKELLEINKTLLQIRDLLVVSQSPPSFWAELRGFIARLWSRENSRTLIIGIVLMLASVGFFAVIERFVEDF